MSCQRRASTNRARCPTFVVATTAPTLADYPPPNGIKEDSEEDDDDVGDLEQGEVRLLHHPRPHQVPTSQGEPAFDEHRGDAVVGEQRRGEQPDAAASDHEHRHFWIRCLRHGYTVAIR